MIRALLALLVAAPALAVASTTTTVTFNYTGGEQTFVVPSAVTSVHVVAQGAQGYSGTNPGGLGGQVAADVSVGAGQVLYVYVGGMGTLANGSFTPAGGGFNGGGHGMSGGTSIHGGGGGGASDVRRNGNALGNRIVVAAGGGGSTDAAGATGGAGGGTSGIAGAGSGVPGMGGTQASGGSGVAPGSLAQGGNANTLMSPPNAGGGGGYYGGGASESAGGGGGSSFFNSPGVVTNATTFTGVRSGHGMVTITYTVLSSDANLASLNVSSGTLSPPFSASTTSYTVNVATTVTQIQLSGTTVDTNATLSIGGAAAAPRTQTRTVALNVGANPFNFVVTAENGATKTYTVTVNRAAPTVPAAPTIGTASATVGQATVNFTPNNDGGSPITSFRVTCTSTAGTSSATGNGSPLVVTGMVNGVAYNCSATAHNSVGDSAPSGTVTVTPGSAPTITSGAPPVGRVNVPYSHTFTATGAPASIFTIISGSLPPGLTLASNGTLSGTPTTAGVYNATVRARNGVSPDSTQSFSVTVNPVARVNAHDMDRDGFPDILWSNTANGATYVWHMNGLNLRSDAFIGQIDPSWKVDGIADFDGDGRLDLVWRNASTGVAYVWYMNDNAFISDAFLISTPVEWVIQGVADFNADGHPDVLMRNTVTGEGFVRFFNNAAQLGTDQPLFTVDPSWKVEAVGDLNGDNQPDLLFRSMASGLAFAWNTQWDGVTLSLGASSPPIFSIDPAWEIAQLEDWNADGKLDLLFRNRNSGVVFVWYMNGTTLGTNDFMTQIDPSWEIVPRR